MNLKKISTAYITYIYNYQTYAFVQTSINWLRGPKKIGQTHFKVKEKSVLGILIHNLSQFLTQHLRQILKLFQQNKGSMSQVVSHIKTDRTYAPYLSGPENLKEPKHMKELLKNIALTYIKVTYSVCLYIQLYIHGLSRRYPTMQYEIQRHLLKKIHDTRNIVHRIETPQSPSTWATWDLTQFSQSPSAAPSYSPGFY